MSDDVILTLVIVSIENYVILRFKKIHLIHKNLVNTVIMIFYD